MDQINKYLLRTPASRNTTGDKSRGVARGIGRVPLIIKLLNDDAVTNVANVFSFWFQYNVSAPQDFYITNWNRDFYEQHLRDSLLILRWRVGSVAHRYLMAGNNVNSYSKTQFGATVLFYPELKVKKNCVFEFWCNPEGFGAVGNGLSKDLSIRTNILSVPETASETETVLLPTLLSDRSGCTRFVPDVDKTLVPQPPLVQPDICWLDNP
jgi:hypothetical protein